MLFGVVSGAIWGPLVFGPMFAGRALSAHELVVPWLAAAAFTLTGLAVSFGVRPDPKELSAAYRADSGPVEPAAPLREILRRPGVGVAMVAAVSSFAVMAGVMNLAGYVAVGHHHRQGDVFTIISLHIVGMYGLVLVVGDLIDRIGRRRSMVIGLSVMALSNAGLVWLGGIPGMSLSLFGLGLGWNLSYVAATTDLVDLAAASERGRLVGLTDLLSSVGGAALALGGGVVYTAAAPSRLALAAAGLAVFAAAWVAGNGVARPGALAHVEPDGCYHCRPAGTRPLPFRMKTYNPKPGEIQRDWLIVDAEGQTLGRLATQIAERLRGKNKPQFAPHVDTGDFVVVINAEKITVTGKKLEQKIYYRHSGYPGGLRERTLKEQLNRQPTEVLRKAVKGMLPRNRLGRAQLTKLKIYAGPEHPHEAQAPTTLEV